jgi:hypothetical protein
MRPNKTFEKVSAPVWPHPPAALLTYVAELEAAIEAYCTPVCVDCELQGCELYPYRKEHHD